MIGIVTTRTNSISGRVGNSKIAGVVKVVNISPSPIPPGRVGDHFVGVLSNSPSPIVLTSTVKSYTVEGEN